MGWELLTGLLDSSKGRKPTLILRTQLSVRVNVILGECVRTSVSRNTPPYIYPFWLSFFQACRQGSWKTRCVTLLFLPCPLLPGPGRCHS